MVPTTLAIPPGGKAPGLGGPLVASARLPFEAIPITNFYDLNSSIAPLQTQLRRFLFSHERFTHSNLAVLPYDGRKRNFLLCIYYLEPEGTFPHISLKVRVPRRGREKKKSFDRCVSSPQKLSEPTFFSISLCRLKSVSPPSSTTPFWWRGGRFCSHSFYPWRAVSARKGVRFTV